MKSGSVGAGRSRQRPISNFGGWRERFLTAVERMGGIPENLKPVLELLRGGRCTAGDDSLPEDDPSNRAPIFERYMEAIYSAFLLDGDRPPEAAVLDRAYYDRQKLLTPQGRLEARRSALADTSATARKHAEARRKLAEAPRTSANSAGKLEDLRFDPQQCDSPIGDQSETLDVIPELLEREAAEMEVELTALQQGRGRPRGNRPSARDISLAYTMGAAAMPGLSREGFAELWRVGGSMMDPPVGGGATAETLRKTVARHSKRLRG